MAEPGGEGSGQRSGVLGYFGMDTPERARETLLWVSPYLAVLALGLGGLSLLVQRFFPLPVWVHVLAIALALLYFLLFLARIRQMGAETGEEDEPEEGT
ncbi:MAG: hypothetical protein Kow0092_08850 [Deferrisomatales bacterium]